MLTKNKNRKCARCGEKPEWLKGKGKSLYCPPCHVKEFIERNCCHTKGVWMGVPFHILPWQEDIIDRGFGALRENGLRQYRTVYVEIPKKNGKTEFGAALALYGICGDGENGAEVYSAAADKDQAGLVYVPASYMVKSRPALKRRLKVIDSQKRIVDYDTASFYKVLSAEAFTKHGINPSTIVFDELHAQPTRELYDVLTEGTDVARSQQIIFVLTTAGIEDKTSIGYEVHEYARKVRDGIIDDPTFLPIIYGLEEDEDFEDREIWRRANPSMDTIFSMEKMDEAFRGVVNNPLRLNNFLRFRLNKWVGQVSRFILVHDWDKCEKVIDEELLVGRPCYAGLDLSTVTDISALVLVFPPLEKNDRYTLKSFFWVPEDNIHRRAKEDRVPYDMWVQAGFIEATPGNVVDYDFILERLKKLGKIYQLLELAYDRWNATKLSNDLQKAGFVTDPQSDERLLVEFGQGFASMSAPTKELNRMVLSQQLEFNKNPVMRWMVDNLAVQMDAAGNYKPNKDKSRDKIDGVVALIMALDRAIKSGVFWSVYDDRGVIAL